jgi:hypothetical protein
VLTAARAPRYDGCVAVGEEAPRCVAETGVVARPCSAEQHRRTQEVIPLAAISREGLKSRNAWRVKALYTELKGS